MTGVLFSFLHLRRLYFNSRIRVGEQAVCQPGRIVGLTDGVARLPHCLSDGGRAIRVEQGVVEHLAEAKCKGIVNRPERRDHHARTGADKLRDPAGSAAEGGLLAAHVTGVQDDRRAVVAQRAPDARTGDGAARQPLVVIQANRAAVQRRLSEEVAVGDDVQPVEATRLQQGR